MKANTGKVINISTTLHGNHYHHHPVSVLYPSVGRRTVHPAGHRRGRHRRNLLSGGCQLLHLRLVRTYHRTLVIRRVTRSLHPRRLLDATFQDTGKYSLHKSIDSTAATQDQLSVQPGDEGVAVTRLAPHRQCRHRRPVGGSQICRRFSGRRYSRNSSSRRGRPNHSQKEINILFTL